MLKTLYEHEFTTKRKQHVKCAAISLALLLSVASAGSIADSSNGHGPNGLGPK